MNPRERFVKTLKFAHPDRIYYSFGPPRKSTLEAWKLQGLPEMPEADDYNCPDEFYEFVGIDPNPWQLSQEQSFQVELGIYPPFEVAIIKEDESGLTWRDEKGIDGTFPCEIAADNDPLAYRRKYGKDLALWGCLDKREIRSKEMTYLEVMSKVPQLVEQGGFLPAVDHAVPPDVPLRSYLYMAELIKAIAEKRRIPQPDDPLPIEKQLGPIQRFWGPDLLERVE